MLESLKHMISQEAERIARGAIRRVILLSVGLVFAMLALIFAAIALFIWLAAMMAPALAGLAVAGMALLLALIAILLGARGRSGRKPPAKPAPQTEEEKRMAEAEALGTMMGRDLRGIPLIITALAVGMIVGRMRR